MFGNPSELFIIINIIIYKKDCLLGVYGRPGKITYRLLSFFLPITILLDGLILGYDIVQTLYY